MTRLTGWVLGVVAVLFMMAIWLPFVGAQEATVSAVAPAESPDLMTLVLTFLLVVSEGLAFVPSLKANGVLHAVTLALRQMAHRRGLPVVLLAVLALGLTACTALKGTMLDGRVCTVWTAADLTVANVQQLVAQLPEGTDRAKVESAVLQARAVGATGTALCELLRGIEGQTPTHVAAVR